MAVEDRICPKCRLYIMSWMAAHTPEQCIDTLWSYLDAERFVVRQLQKKVDTATMVRAKQEA
jgi:hypothetical protein